MTKTRDDIQDLKRRLGLLDKLDGGAVVCADGVFLVQPGLVRDPRPLVKACQAGRPTSAALRAAMGPAAQPIAVGRELLAAAHRDLRAIEAAPRLVALAREARRIFRRFGELDDVWFAHKRARLSVLAELIRESEAPPREPSAGAMPPWFSRVLDLVRLVHGDDAVLAVQAALGRLADGARARRAEARRALAELIAGIEGKREPVSRAVMNAVIALREAQRLAGRSRARRVATIVRELLGARGEGDTHAAGDASLALADQVRAVGERIVAGLDRPSDPAYLERAYRFFAWWALAFNPVPRDKSALVVRPEQMELGVAKLGDAIERLGGKKLTLIEALAILGLDMNESLAEVVVGLVEAGFPIAKVQKLAALGRLDDLFQLDEEPKAAEAYADWAITLGAHYASLGLAVPISPEMFATFRGTRREDLGVLAACLMKHHARAEPGGAEDALARLDATLGLFRRRPADAARVLAELSGTSKGAGRELFPELAAWLGDDALLDRAVHLLRLAGLPVAISRSLRADFDRRAAQERERAHLASLSSPSQEQRERLSRLERGEVELPGPDKTRRRLADRVRELHALAYEARLAAIFKGILKEVWGISIGRLTPAWHDAIRFSFAVDDHRELLGTVLRAAADGLDLTRTLPANRAWIEEVKDRFDVDAWLAPRARDVTIGGETMRLAIERDPVEVLRMGIPFDTCLSLEGGSNSASTVVNAADANKQVIYLRDRAGKILARKLIAVSTDATLIGYRLYTADKKKRAEIEPVFGAMCLEIAKDARLPLASTGTPKKLQPGFWYDDGTVAFTAADDVGAPLVTAYCEALGQAPPRVVSPELAREAAAFDALARGDAGAMKAAIGNRESADGPCRRAARWLVERATPAELAGLVDDSSMVASVAVELAMNRGYLAALDLVGRLGDAGVSRDAFCGLARFPRTEEIARAIVAAGFAYKRHARGFQNEGFEHQTMYLLPEHAREIPVAVALSLCDRVDPLWGYVAESSEDCGQCRESAEIQVIDAIEAGHARAPDPDAILRTLEAPRSSLLARRAALRIAAVYALAEDAPPRFPPPFLQRVRPCPAAMRALARMRQRAPELESDPDLFAALLRQSAGSLPHGVTLPTPREPPFDALGDLLSQLDLESLLSPWLAFKGVASAWKPTPWELYFHRRHRTARRAALALEAASHAPSGSAASDLLALLGDVEAIAPLVPAQIDPAPKRAPHAKRGHKGKASSPGGRELKYALLIARDIAAQIAAADGGNVLSMELASIELPLGLLRQDERAVDPALLVAAFGAALRHLAGEGVDPARIFVAFVILGMGRAPTIALRRLVEEIVPRASPADAELDFIEAFIRDRTTWFCPEVPHELAVAIARHPRLRPQLFTALARTGDDRFEPGFQGVLAAAKQAGGEALEETMFSGWIPAVMARNGHEHIARMRDEALFRRAAAIALGGVQAASALEIYKEIESHERAAVFLAELVKSPERTSAAMRAAVKKLSGWGAEAANAAKYEWLVRAMKSRAPRAAP